MYVVWEGGKILLQKVSAHDIEGGRKFRTDVYYSVSTKSLRGFEKLWRANKLS
jgi:hypothetical protein